jgi:serine/threonine protein kinase
LRNEHPNIITVLDWGVIETSDGERPFYVMPVYPKTLQGLMNDSIPHERVLPYFEQFLSGVDAAHKLGVWHRDLKPENVLYDPENDRLVVADFGIAHFAEPLLQTLVRTGARERMANFRYAAPEQRTEGGKVDYRADIYALGLILNEMFTGELLVGTGHKLISSVAPEYGYLDPLVDLMARQSPDDRPASIDEIKKQLISRGNEFVSLQKLNQLKNTVVRSDEPDDPLLTDPIRLASIDFDGEQLQLILNRQPNADWIRAFHSIGGFRFIVGKEPANFQFYLHTAVIPATERQVQMLVDYFKSYVEKANLDYREHVRNTQLKREEAMRRDLQERIAREERRQRVLKSTRI